MEIGIVCGSFHREDVEKMLKWAEDEASKLKLTISDIVWVPGAFEVPLATKRLFEEGCAGVVTLGIIERGQTLHGQAMGQAVMSALIDLQLDYESPVGLGIIGPGADPEHIEPRLESHARAAIAAIAAMSF